MKTYKWILFDADETLFHFDAFSGLRLMFSKFGIEFTNENYTDYQILNKSLWIAYQNGEIKAEQLQHKRFDIWSNKLKVKPGVLNSAFLLAMADICTPIEGAVSLLNKLQGKVRLGIITNGFTQLQKSRLEHTGLIDYFDVLVISEEVGVAKPDPGIFEYAMSIMDNPKPMEVLMVGDNPDSDIIGGINAGLDTCWLNLNNSMLPKNIIPKYQINSLLELENILFT